MRRAGFLRGDADRVEWLELLSPRLRKIHGQTGFPKQLIRLMSKLMNASAGGGFELCPCRSMWRLSASMASRDAKLSSGWLPTPLTLRSRPRGGIHPVRGVQASSANSGDCRREVRTDIHLGQTDESLT